MSHSSAARARPARRRRRPLRAAARLTIGTRTVDVVTRNLSADGVQVLLDPEDRAPLTPGARLLVSVDLPAGLFRAEARITWFRVDVVDHRGRGRIAAGLTFLELPPEARLRLEELEATARPLVLLLGTVDEPSLELLEQGFEIRRAAAAGEALERLDRDEIAVGLLGTEWAGAAARDFLAGVKERFPEATTRFVVLAAGADLSLFQPFVDDDTAYFLTGEPVAPKELLAIAQSAAASWARLREDPGLEGLDPDLHLGRLRRLLEVSQRLSIQTELAWVAETGREGVQELLAADRAYCLVYDPGEQTLWARDPRTGEERRESAAAGIVSFVARTGLPLRVPAAARDARHDREADDPAGTGDERLLAVPVTDPGGGRVLAVMVAVRAASSAEFDQDDVDTAAMLARQVGAVLGRLLLQEALEEAATEAGASSQGPDLFRREALQYHFSGQDRGGLLQLTPHWMTWSYRSIAAAAVCCVVYLLFGRVSEYGTGVAVVRLEGRTEVAAAAGGTVRAVDAHPGQRVAAGQVLARLNDAAEAAELDRVNREFELQLIARLRDPADAAAAGLLTSLRPQKTLAEARLRERWIRAPRPGVVSDVRIREGQPVAPGDTALTLVDERAGGHVIALLPGQYRPKLRPGQSLRLTLTGFAEAPQSLTVESVAEEVVGRDEARRFLGSRVSEEMLPAGPVVLVRATIPGTAFRADGQTYVYHEGMIGSAEIRLRSQPLLLELVPGLNALFHG